MKLPGFEDFTFTISPKLEKLVNAVRLRLLSFTIDNPVLSSSLCREFGINVRELRTIVQYLRVTGEPIGSTSKGYFTAIKASELDLTMRHLEARAQKIYTIYSVMKKTRESMEKGSSQGRLFL